MIVAQLKKELTGGECIRISTGAAVPSSADAVVQVEDTQLLKATDDGKTELEIMILKAPTCGQDIRLDNTVIVTQQLLIVLSVLSGQPAFLLVGMDC